MEGQTEVLKEQLAKEMRRRQVFISGNVGIDNELSEVRHNLGESLYNVASSPKSNFDIHLLEKESQRLNSTIERYGGDYTSRLTPSRLLTSSMRGAASMDNLMKDTSTPIDTNKRYSSRKTLSFNQEN